jgi:alkyl hydroperoxide reductase subunit AhpC
MTQRLSLNSVAPDFELQDADFTPVKLSKFREGKTLYLFSCEICLSFLPSQLAQLQQDYYEFQRRDAEIITIGPDGRIRSRDIGWRITSTSLGLPIISHKWLKSMGRKLICLNW